MAAGRKEKICRVCGKAYETCVSAKRPDGVFNWREVACSPECGEKYLLDILRSRGELAKEPRQEKKGSGKKLRDAEKDTTDENN